MIKLEDSQITQIIPDCFKTDPKVQALSYALNKAIRKVLSYANMTSIYASIDKLPASMLDVLAVELRTQYYDENLDIQTKRNLVKNTLAWHGRAGTVPAVQELIDNVFNEGTVLEWWETGGEPGTFEISTSQNVTPELLKAYNDIIYSVKNVRAHLSSITVGNKMIGYPRVSIGIATRKVIQIH